MISPSNLHEASIVGPEACLVPRRHNQGTNSPSLIELPVSWTPFMEMDRALTLSQPEIRTLKSSPESSGHLRKWARLFLSPASPQRSGHLLKTTWIVSGRARMQTHDSALLSPLRASRLPCNSLGQRLARMGHLQKTERGARTLEMFCHQGGWSTRGAANGDLQGREVLCSPCLCTSGYADKSLTASRQCFPGCQHV